jgi:RNA polymerase sporulation-specific sigma factor
VKTLLEVFMMNKVEITGVNTAKLATLTNKEMNELLLRIKDGDLEARNKMIIGNLKLVLSVIKKFNIEEIMQTICFRLVQLV